MVIFNPKCPHEVGDRVDFVPTMLGGFSPPQTVHGTVIAINEEHRHYTLEGRLHGAIIRETYKY